VKALALRASYAFLHSEDRSRAGRQEQQYTPRHKAAIEATYDFAFGLQPYASIAYVGGQYYYTKENVATVEKRRLADYALVDVRLRQRLLRDSLSLYVGVANLLDRYYETSYGFPQPGRFLYGGFEVRL
jgi:outer membrane receptor protein involved in Fe transport